MVWGCLVRGLHPVSSHHTSTSVSLGWGERCRRLPPCVNRLDTWNVSWINGIAKREEMEDVFRKGNFELLDLTETKLKGNEEVSWCGMNSIIVSVQEIERDRD